MTDRMMLDGNAVAGLLRELFDHEMTTVMRSCACCGRAWSCRWAGWPAESCSVVRSVRCDPR